MIDIFIARQPIFDRTLKVVAYELLFRSSLDNQYSSDNEDQATFNVISNAFLSFGIDKITDGKKAFINFSGELLKGKVANLMPNTLLAVEVLETVIPDPQILTACQELKNAGYTLVLDDFIFTPQSKALIPFADIIKIDFKALVAPERAHLASYLHGAGITLLAEKIETHIEFQQALSQGFSLFQGFFFSKPLVMTRSEIPLSKMSHFRLLRELNSPSLNIKTVEDIIQKDVALSYQLLKYINSSAFGFQHSIRSIRQAIALLGQREFGKWVALIALRSLGERKPSELLSIAIIRARMSELIATTAHLPQLAPLAFITGMFSLLDAFLDQPMDHILTELPVDDKIKSALLGTENELRYILDLVISYEQGNWSALSAQARQNNIDETALADAYYQSLAWIKDIAAI